MLPLIAPEKLTLTFKLTISFKLISVDPAATIKLLTTSATTKYLPWFRSIIVGFVDKLDPNAWLAFTSEVKIFQESIIAVGLELTIKYFKVPAWVGLSFEITPVAELTLGVIFAISGVVTTGTIWSSSEPDDNIFSLDIALFKLLTVTVIITSPAFSGVTSPLLSTLAINGLEDDHLISLTSPLSGVMIGLSWTLWVRKTSDETISNATELTLTVKGTILTL